MLYLRCGVVYIGRRMRGGRFCDDAADFEVSFKYLSCVALAAAVHQQLFASPWCAEVAALGCVGVRHVT